MDEKMVLTGRVNIEYHESAKCEYAFIKGE
ncbi:hypothetical protein AVP43_00793 [Geobacillus stearothermophilus]|nr:hypothetical protein AVP43_00793 [Geobacillus stearothermophilus]